MLSNIRQISLLNKIFNVRGNEWPKIGIAWLVTLLYRIGFVIGWTVLVALFVTNYGIASLPYLFVINAAFSIIGSLIYSTFLDKISKELLMTITIFLTCVVLFAGYLFSDNLIFFFAMIIVAESLFLGQLRIILHGYTEELFSPIQSERTFPLIESSETVGGIIAGLIVTVVAGVLNPVNFILIWIGALMLMVPFIFIHKAINKKVRVIKKEKKENGSIGIFTKLKRELKKDTHISYIKGIFLIVFFQWLLFNLIEFQYTKAVYQNVSDVILQGGSGFEHAFIHDLGQLFILFSGSALVIQLFVGSRLISSLGVVGTMLLHPIVTLFSILGLTYSFSFNSAVFTKNNFTITTVLHTNAYHSSYYAVKDKLREHVREFLDGIVRPIGAIVGTVVIIVLQRLLVGEGLIFYVNISMIAVCLILLYVTYTQQSKYTQVALDDLQKSKDRHVRFNAIDILAQKGHKYPISVLTYILHNKSEPISIRVRILRALAIIKDITVIEDIVKCVGSRSMPIRRAAVDALLSYKELFKDPGSHLMVEHNLIDSLKRYYENEKFEDLRRDILRLLSTISTVATFDYLIHALKTSKGDFKANVINALGNYSDQNVADVVKKYLNSKNNKQKLSAIIALGRFKETRADSIKIISTLIRSEKKKVRIDGLIAVGELELKQEKDLCVQNLTSTDEKVRIYSAVALMKMGYEESIPVLIKYLFKGKKELAKLTKSLLLSVDGPVYPVIKNIIEHMVVQEVEKIIPEDVNMSYKNLRKKDLKKLKWLYSLVEEYDEVDSINLYLSI
jgi:HEAT repeat protein/MFS family permease